MPERKNKAICTFAKSAPLQDNGHTETTRQRKELSHGTDLHTARRLKRPLYDMLMGNGQLVPHLASVQKQAAEQVRRTVKRMAEKQNVTEELKARDQMMWVGMMNNIKHSAEESVLHDLIYR